MNYLFDFGVIEKLDDFFYVFCVVVGVTDYPDTHRFLFPQNNTPAISRRIFFGESRLAVDLASPL